MGAGGKVSMRPDPGALPSYQAQYSNGAYDGYDQHNVSGSLANTSLNGSGAGAASQSFVGMGMLSPLALDSQPRTQTSGYAKTKGWGQTRSTGSVNRAYDYDQTQQQHSTSVSSVSHTYSDMTRPSGYSATTPQRPTKPSASRTPQSSSTEV